MKIGFFGGSFNPPSNIHINLAREIVKEFKLDKIIFVPVGNYYEKKSLIDSEHRYNMLKLAIEKHDELDVETIAIDSTKKLYAIDTFEIISKKYSNSENFFIMGSDNYRKMPDWKGYEKLISEYKFIVIEREKKEIRKNQREMVYIPKHIAIIDSTKIREMVKRNEIGQVKEFLDDNVYEYIKKNKLYI